MSDERIIEMTWRCSACQHQNLGRHKSCQTCGNPKDPSEHFEMPDDTTREPSVTDPTLLRAANAGPDWRCRYCGGHQRRLDQSCANCGAGRDERAPQTLVSAPPPKPRRLFRHFVVLAVAAIGAFLWYVKRPHDIPGTVTAVAWEHVIEVDRFAMRGHEAFRDALPAGALDVRSLGQRVHHTERVHDGYSAERYTVDVPDGYRTESYTEREACGEDCTPIPEKCREVCKSNDNGFASCRTVCTGGGEKCRTRYCRVTKTRDVPRTRSEWRVRDVPRYRQEPRYAEAVAYKLWTWAPERTARETGTDPTALRWPSGARMAGLARGEQERERRGQSYIITLRYQDTQSVRFRVTTPEQFSKFAPGTTHPVRRDGDIVIIDGIPVAPIEEGANPPATK